MKKKLDISIFGESHGEAIGVVLSGVPAGIPIDMKRVMKDMERRAPGKDSAATTRIEPDVPNILSGVFNGYTTGSPIAAIIKNTDQRSIDYSKILNTPRPGHADYVAHVKYHGFSDMRGGGHFSGRLTAPLVFAGAIARAYLSKQGVFVGAHMLEVAGVCDIPFDLPNKELLDKLYNMKFPLIDTKKEALMREKIDNAKDLGDSVGGMIECAAIGVPKGLGDTLFESVESKLAYMLFAIPAVKSVEFGARDIYKMRGSEANDSLRMENGHVIFKTNNSGGINGGITNGMPIIARAGIRPTPSIAKEQDTVDLGIMENVKLAIKGRHDACIALRALPGVEAVVSLGIMDLML